MKVFMKQSLFALSCSALLCLAVLTGCGDSGKTYEPFAASAISTFGDGLLDAGQTGSLYTINSTDPATPSLSIGQHLASNWGLTLKPQSQSGMAYAQGLSTVAGTIAQVDARLAQGGFTAGELVLVSAGMEDVRAQVQAIASGSVTVEQAHAQLKEQATQLVRQLERMEAAGARHIYWMPVYDLGRSPWAINLATTLPNAQTIASNAASIFNSQMSLVGETQSTLKYTLFSPTIRSRMSVILNTDNSSTTGFTNITQPVCSGAGATDASKCTTDTLAVTTAEAAAYAFADAHHPTPLVLASLASYALSDIKSRW